MSMDNQGNITHEDVERISRENRDRWIDSVDRAGYVADELNTIACLFACADFVNGECVRNGIYSIIERGADTIRELCDLATTLSRKPSPQPDQDADNVVDVLDDAGNALDEAATELEVHYIDISDSCVALRERIAKNASEGRDVSELEKVLEALEEAADRLEEISGACLYEGASYLAEARDLLSSLPPQ